MILHLLYDEKITDHLIDNFEYANPSGNIFLVYNINSSSTQGYKHIKKVEKVKPFYGETDDINRIIKQFPEIKAIICHGLGVDSAKEITKIKKPLKIFWFIWGFDLYNLPKIKPNIYAPITKKYIYKTRVKKIIKWDVLDVLRKKIFLPVYFRIINKKTDGDIVVKAHQMVDYCVSYIKNDYDFFRLAYPHYKADFFEVRFLNLNQYLDHTFLDKEICGNNILIGNSNTLASNHLDVFCFLKHKLKGDEKVYVPLSYGEDEYYKKMILEEGRKDLGNAFMPLLDFLSLNDYLKIQLSCGVGIFYHYRQQAMGNIIAMLWIGARIYMASKSPAFQYLQGIGIIIFSLDKDFDQYGNNLLSQSEVAHNREILLMHFSKEKVENDYKKLINAIYN
ncbi:MAG: TDP-N-acetylfucosamine:lipid II N-acetylfucosaminyltransferase [Chitinophagaceae bacterium]|nr:TDP-N-acetylfucosamine:lipid II N-acetylfucosaminyltransferase [Chitinophagaceae bacterium]